MVCPCLAFAASPSLAAAVAAVAAALFDVAFLLSASAAPARDLSCRKKQSNKWRREWIVMMKSAAGTLVKIAFNPTRWPQT